MTDPTTADEAPRPDVSPVAETRGVRRSRRRAVLAVIVVAVVTVTVVVIGGHGRPAHRPFTLPTPTRTPTTTPTVRDVPGSPVGSLPVPPGFPSATTTGVTAGTRLTAYTGPLVITDAGTVVTDAAIAGCLVIQGDDVTVEDSTITCVGKKAVVSVLGAASGAILTDDELDGAGVAVAGLDAQNVVATRLNIFDSGDGVHLGHDVTLQDSYVHDLARQPGIHHDALQTLKGSEANDVRILHNTLQDVSADSNGNSVYHGGTGAISDIEMIDNYMDGGQYTLFLDNGPEQHDIVFRDNHFGRHYRYALLILGQADGSAVTFTGNVYEDDGEAATVANSAQVGPAASPTS